MLQCFAQAVYSTTTHMCSDVVNRCASTPIWVVYQTLRFALEGRCTLKELQACCMLPTDISSRTLSVALTTCPIADCSEPIVGEDDTDVRSDKRRHGRGGCTERWIENDELYNMASGTS